ncbi:MAG: MATE family efflux transporter [Methanobacteriaceae archaeon]
MPQEKTSGVKTLTGDPKKAILKLSGPTIISMLLSSLYTLIDGIWVAGLGGDALAAIGFVTPLFMIVMGFANGIGAGATSAISRAIGANKKSEADNGAIHSLLIGIILTVIFTAVFLIFSKPILMILGAGDTVDLALSYSNILFSGTIFIVFTSVAYGILRAEGNVVKVTYAMAFAAVLNIILDPIFIYTLNLGIAGAAWATLISMSLVSILLVYWFKKNTYLKIRRSNFKYNPTLIKRILSVGLPAGSEFLIISLLTASLNIILVIVSGVDAVAIYSTGWRVIMVAFIPTIAIGISTVAVTGATLGAGKLDRLKTIQNYGIKISLVIATVTTALSIIFAGEIAGLFTYSSATASLKPMLTEFLRIISLFYIIVPIGLISLSVLQGLGKGLMSLVLNIIREVVFVLIFAYILAITLGWGEYGVWWAVIVGNIFGDIISFIWTRYYINKVIKKEIILK